VAAMGELVHHRVAADRGADSLGGFVKNAVMPSSLIGIAGGVEAATYADRYSGAWTHPP